MIKAYTFCPKCQTLALCGTDEEMIEVSHYSKICCYTPDGAKTESELQNEIYFVKCYSCEEVFENEVIEDYLVKVAEENDKQNIEFGDKIKPFANIILKKLEEQNAEVQG